MKKLFLLLFVATFVLFTSCEKDAEPEPYSLSTDLQNGYWDAVNSSLILKFDGTNIKFSSVCESEFCSPNFPCLEELVVTPYTLEDNTMTIEGGGPVTIKIEGDILTVDDTIVHERKLTLDYPDC